MITLTRLLRWLFPSPVIPHWTTKRVQRYELVNKIQLGIVCEPVFVWSHQYRKKLED